MDFDPTAFLSMAMTEDADAVYTAPDVPQGSPIKIPQGTITVEGGLQMEQHMQIPVPVFGLLQHGEPMEEDEDEQHQNDTETPDNDNLIQVDITETENSTTPQPSPGERTSSPFNKKLIHVTWEETRFRKDFFCGHYERVKILRLHCSICDRHLGCAPWFTERQMRVHKLLSVAVCRKCFEFYGDINYIIEEGSELYCCWCGEGGECFCCSTCPKIVCKNCIRRNFGETKIKEIDENDDWSCFVCKPESIWPHRALLWGLQRWGRGMRQLVATLAKEEKQAKLSLDTSHCCLKFNKEFSPVSIPAKSIFAKIPMCLIAAPYQNHIRNLLSRPDSHNSTKNVPNSIANNQVNYNSGQYMNNSLPMLKQAPSNSPVNVPHQMHRGSPTTYQVRQQNIELLRKAVVNRSAPYPVSRPMPPLTRHPAPSTHYYPQRAATHQVPPYGGVNRPAYQPELVDLEKESILQRSLQTPLFDLDWLEKGVGNVKDAIRPTFLLLEQFNAIRNELASDFDKLTSYSDRLSYNIKIAICNLAKYNQDIIESQKKIIDNRVSSVVNNIQLTAVNGISSIINISHGESSPAGSKSNAIPSSSRSVAVSTNSPPTTPAKSSRSAAEQQTPATPSSSTGEDVEDAAIAMLCETILEVEENKENKNDRNKGQTSDVQDSQQQNNIDKKGKMLKRKVRSVQNHNLSSKIPIINLIDDDEDKGNKVDDNLLKKFNIKPCTVALERLEICKVVIN